MRKVLIVGIAFITLLTGCKDNPTLTDNRDQKINLDQLKTGWVLINYWATWCSPCKEEIPMLNKFYQTQKGHIKFYGVNYDGLEAEKLNQAISQFHIQFPVLQQNPNTLLHLGAITVVPTTFLLHDGVVVKSLAGPQTVASLNQAIG